MEQCVSDRVWAGCWLPAWHRSHCASTPFIHFGSTAVLYPRSGTAVSDKTSWHLAMYQWFLLGSCADHQAELEIEIALKVPNVRVVACFPRATRDINQLDAVSWFSGVHSRGNPGTPTFPDDTCARLGHPFTLCVGSSGRPHIQRECWKAIVDVSCCQKGGACSSNRHQLCKVRVYMLLQTVFIISNTSLHQCHSF